MTARHPRNQDAPRYTGPSADDDGPHDHDTSIPTHGQSVNGDSDDLEHQVDRAARTVVRLGNAVFDANSPTPYYKRREDPAYRAAVREMTAAGMALLVAHKIDDATMHGTGPTVECPTCHGAGWVEDSPGAPDGSRSGCPVCTQPGAVGGTGRVHPVDVEVTKLGDAQPEYVTGYTPAEPRLPASVTDHDPASAPTTTTPSRFSRCPSTPDGWHTGPIGHPCTACGWPTYPGLHHPATTT